MPSAGRISPTIVEPCTAPSDGLGRPAILRGDARRTVGPRRLRRHGRPHLRALRPKKCAPAGRAGGCSSGFLGWPLRTPTAGINTLCGRLPLPEPRTTLGYTMGYLATMANNLRYINSLH